MFGDLLDSCQDTFENNFEIKFKLTKYLKESCMLDLEQLFPFKYFL